jgi:hypothetical protein
MKTKKRGTDPRNPHPTKKVKTVKKVEPSPLGKLVFDSYTLAKQIVAGYIVRAAKKKAKVKLSQSLFNSRSNRDIVAELTERFDVALMEEIKKVAGWEK